MDYEKFKLKKEVVRINGLNTLQLKSPNKINAFHCAY